MSVRRSGQNPIISPKDVKPSRPDFEVVCVFNCGVTRYRGQVLLLLRVAEVATCDHPNQVRVPIFNPTTDRIEIKEFDKKDQRYDFSDSRFVLRRQPWEQYLTSISHFRVAKSDDGINFTVEEEPAMVPANTLEVYGIEDPRITLVDGLYYINYSCISPYGVTTCLATTKDFSQFQRHGVIFAPDNKDVTFFPEKIGGLYYALNRPVSEGWNTKDVWISASPDLKFFGQHRFCFGRRQDDWDCERVGASAIPFRVEDGWLEIYHGVDQSLRYCLGAVLLDKEKPWQVIARSKRPIIEPEAEYEVHGFFGNVIFNNGVLFEDNIVKIYYGAADTHVGYAEINLKDVLATF